MNDAAQAEAPGGTAAADALALVLDYHRRSTHRLDGYAAGPGTLDWDTQPDPFRRWQGTRHYDLPRDRPDVDIPWSELDAARSPAPFDVRYLSTLLRLTAAVTAWKEHGGSRWALRAHPSSGNLHPTETWVVSYWVEGLADGLYHYQSREHTLEWRASTLAAADNPGLWLGFSSIHWREAWKYGERAFRYCQLDLGHVLAALAHAAALLGWTPRLLPLSSEATAHCLGTDRTEDYAGVESEEADVIVALHGERGAQPPMPPPDWDEWSGLPSLLDPRPMYHWPVIDTVAEATRGPVPSVPARPEDHNSGGGAGGEGPSPPAARVILERRSAQAFDGRSAMPLALFRHLLSGLLPGGSPVWRMWALTPRIHPVVLVHRVEGLKAGVYCLPRSAAARQGLAAAMRQSFEWAPVDPDLPLYRLVPGRPGNIARTLSCHQDIASQGAFTFMFVAEFATPVADHPAAYRHLHWEAGMLGHVATLGAEAAGWRGTGIGCFFDDAGHELLGLADARYQVLYHYAVGMPVDDPRITTLPAYG